MAFAFSGLSASLDSILLVGHLKTTQPEAAVSSSQKDDSEAEDSSIDIGGGKYGIHIRHLIQLMAFYGIITYIVVVVIFNLPFLMEKHHFSSGNSGLMISLFFLAITARASA